MKGGGVSAGVKLCVVTEASFTNALKDLEDALKLSKPTNEVNPIKKKKRQTLHLL